MFGGLALGLHVVALSALPSPPAGGAPARAGAPIAIAAPDAALRSLVTAWEAPPEVELAPDRPVRPEVSDLSVPAARPDLRTASLSPAPARPEAAALPDMPRDPAARPPAARPKARPSDLPQLARRGAAGSGRVAVATPAPGQSVAEVERAFGAGVREALTRARRYPDRASSRGVTGTTVLVVTIARDGRLIDVRVTRGSGSDLLDRASVEAASRAAFPAAPAGLDDLRFMFEVPLDFTLR